MTSHDRLKGAAAALAVQGLLGWLLIAGLATAWRRAPETALAVFKVAPPPPPPPVAPPEPRRGERARDRAALPNLRSIATATVAPPPVIPLPVPPPVVAAPARAIGMQATSGAAPVAGLAAGAGGVGDGAGGGGSGDGHGIGSPPRQTHGRLRDSDYPRAAALSGTSGIVGLRYLVEIDGRVGECRVTHPSGSAELDAMTCRLIRERFRFKPSREEHGRKVPAWVIETHEWVIERPPPPSP